MVKFVTHKCSKIRGGHWKSSFEFVAPWSVKASPSFLIALVYST